MKKTQPLKTQPPWWKTGVIYQIYPRSFFDTSGNGIGDLNGITKKLDYIKSLGVDAVWLAPFFKSPMKDFGYDVSDYETVDPLFGHLKDFRNLVKTAHKKKIKIIIDQVLSHTSDDHRWFQESKKSKTNLKADWYVWADANKDGSPPNNWQSIFGGSAWSWSSERKQYYLHNFLKEQPDLNFHHPQVVKNILKTVEFWLKLGVDGFRLDTVNFYFHDRKLRNNPPAKVKSNIAADVNPYTFQSHLYDKNQKENVPFLKKLRKLLDRYGDTTLIGEVGDDERGLDIISNYTKGGDKLHLAYGFDFLSGHPKAEDFKKKIDYFQAIVKDGWICWSFSNHDVVRVLSRWASSRQLGQEAFRKNLAKMLLVLLGSLPGTPCFYQGEELGLEEAVLKYEDLVDPYGINFYPKFVGRDGCRTPMVWQNKKQGGFSQASKTWLPIYHKHLPLNVQVQEKDPDSILNFYRNYLSLRKKTEILNAGKSTIIKGDHPLLVLKKTYLEETVLVVFNLGVKPISYALKKPLLTEEIVLSHQASWQKNTVGLKSFGFLIIKI